MVHLGAFPGIIFGGMRREGKLRRLAIDPVRGDQLPQSFDNILHRQRLLLTHNYPVTSSLGSSIHAPKLAHNGISKLLPADTHVPDRTAHALHPARLDESFGGGPQQPRHAAKILGFQQARAVMQRPRPGKLIRRTRDLERLLPRPPTLLLLHVHDDVVPSVHPHAIHAQPPQRAHHHLGVPVPVKDRRRADDGPVGVACVVEDGAASRAAADEGDGDGLDLGVSSAMGLFQWCGRGKPLAEEVHVHLHPGVLVAADDDAGAVGVEEKDGRVRVGALQEVVLDGKVQVGVGGGGTVDLDGLGKVLRVWPVLDRGCDGFGVGLALGA
jgi:hypothetical protein